MVDDSGPTGHEGEGMLIKVVNKISKKKEEEKTAEAPKAPVPSNEEKLLMEIRDLLKNQK